MTLIVNDIYIQSSKEESLIVACADSRITITTPGQETKYDTKKKLFPIKHLNACVSFWGNTRIKNNKGLFEPLSTWLPNFISKSSATLTLRNFSDDLCENANKNMHSDDLKRFASGFHFSGFDKNNNPEFIHFSNCKWDPVEAKYKDVTFKYASPFADFTEINFKSFFNGDSIDWKNLKDPGLQSYRNGDFKVHDAAWNKLDETFNEIFKLYIVKTKWTFL